AVKFVAQPAGNSARAQDANVNRRKRVERRCFISLGNRGRSGLWGLFAVFDGWPEVIPVERATEFAVMASLTVSGPERTVGEINRLVAFSPPHVEAAGAVAALAADMNHLLSAKLPAVTGHAAEANGVTANALGIGIGLACHESVKRLRVAGLRPDRARGLVAFHATLAANDTGGDPHPRHHVR